jgi:hypothetical protein
LGDDYRAAQSFKPQFGTLTNISLYLNRSSGAGALSISVSVHEDSGDGPGQSLGSTGLSFGVYQTHQWVNATFDPEIANLSRGTTYYIVLRSTMPSISGAYLNWRYDSDGGYSDGSFWTSSDGVSWTEQSNSDACFVTWGLDPELYYTPSLLDFGYMFEDQTRTKGLQISNSGTGNLYYNLSESHDWLELDSSTGNSTDDTDIITVTVNTTGLSVGEYIGIINISSNGGDDSVTVDFTVNPQFITVTSPNNGSMWERGTTKTILWSYSNKVGDVNISLYKDGVYEGVIVESTDSNGWYSWGIPPNILVGTDYQIKISSNINASLWDFSQNFTISPLFDGIIVGETVTNSGHNNPWQITVTEGILEGSICIDLYSDNYENGNVSFGRIWLLDSGSITHSISSSKGIYSVTIGNGGIISSDIDYSSVKKEPIAYEDENNNVFSLHLLQITAASPDSGGVKRYNLKVTTTLYKSRSADESQVYGLRLQLHGVDNEIWKDYFKTNYRFDSSGSDLLYLPSTDLDGVHLKFSYSIIQVEIQ